MEIMQDVKTTTPVSKFLHSFPFDFDLDLG